MNENLKTLIFVVLAAAVAVVAWASRSSSPASSADDFRNQLLNPDFKNPLDAASLQIDKYDDAKGEVASFTVAEAAYKGKTRWSIPSHDDYPADAKNQMASAGAALVGLKIIDKVSDDEGDQEEYGVVDPDQKDLKPGATGIGQRVTMRDKNGKELLSLVIGKPAASDKDKPGLESMSPGNPDLRYVRRVGESTIYLVEAKIDKLSTKFEDWIEPNLLQINTMDLKDLLIHDYSMKVMLDGLAMLPRDKIEIGYNDAEPHWKLLLDQQFVQDEKSEEGGKWTPVPMKADEELNAAKLDELKTALDDLKIVNVSRKPAGLSANLKVAANFTSNTNAKQSLANKGFFALSGELYSNEGEIRVGMKNGVEYVLRFGQITDSGPAAKDAKKAGKDGKKDKDKPATGLNRYLFVMAEFNPNAIPKPTMEKYVEPVKAKEPEKKPAEEKKSEAAKPADGKPGDNKADVKKPDEKKADPKKADVKKPDEKKADVKKPEPPKTPEPPKKTEADKKAEEAERARIEKENKRRQEEYEQQIAEGKKKVAELNLRFADWYYVISDEVYRKIHLSRNELVIKKTKKKEGGKEGEGMGMIPGQNPPIDVGMPAAPGVETAKPKQEPPAGK